MQSAEDTIAAIATAPGRGGIAAVRVSGPDAFSIASRISGREVSAASAGRFFFSKFRDASGLAIDEGLVLVFAAPHSYTGEDAVEFQGHGGAVCPRRVLEACLSRGARLARRGEFSLRAFLNGRMALSSAEAVLDLVDAKTTRAADDALSRMNGGTAALLESLYEEIVPASADLEHFLDFDENDAPEGFDAEFSARIGNLLSKARDAVAAARASAVLRSGVSAVISGPPNAGKSSLLNALLGEKRAIVSAAAGTTRDYIEGFLDIDGWPVRLADTAGLRDDAADEAEAAGVEIAKSLRREADVSIEVEDGTAPDAPVREQAGRRGRPAVKVRSKADAPGFAPREGAIPVSSVTGEGLDALRAALKKEIEALARDPSEDCGGFPSRALAALDEAEKALARAAEEFPGECTLAANSLRAAAEAVGGCIGRVWSDDMLDKVFSRFCVGK